MNIRETAIYLQVGFAVGGNLVRVIARIMKMMTGHKIKTSVQSCKATTEKMLQYWQQIIYLYIKQKTYWIPKDCQTTTFQYRLDMLLPVLSTGK